MFGDRVGKDILFLSISIDPEKDTPRALREYRSYGDPNWTGWLHLTGDFDEIETLRWVLGVYDLDPVIDADKSEHSGLLTFGNDRTDQWAALPALMSSEEIVETVLRITRDASNTPTRAGRGGWRWTRTGREIGRRDRPPRPGIGLKTCDSLSRGSPERGEYA